MDKTDISFLSPFFRWGDKPVLESECRWNYIGDEAGGQPEHSQAFQELPERSLPQSSYENLAAWRVIDHWVKYLMNEKLPKMYKGLSLRGYAGLDLLKPFPKGDA